MNAKTLKILLAFLGIYIIWGSTYLAIRVIVVDLPPFFSMGLRFLLAAVLISIYLLIIGEFKVNLKEFRNTSFLGILMFTGGIGTVAWCEQYVPSGITAIIVALMPLWFMMFDMIINRQGRPKMISIIGILIGFVGIILLVGFKDLANLSHIPLLPFILIMCSTLIWAFASVIGPKLERPKNGYLNLCVQSFAGGLANIAIGFMLGESPSRLIQNANFNSIFAFLYLVILGTIIVLLGYNYLIDNVKPALIATYSYVNPVIALILGWLILNEEINNQIILASSLILVGVLFIKRGNSNGKQKLRFRWKIG